MGSSSQHYPRATASLPVGAIIALVLGSAVVVGCAMAGVLLAAARRRNARRGGGELV